MSNGERLTGISDSVYDLISVLYHAAQGGTVYARYIEDAEREGDTDLAQFFREAQQEDAARAQRAKSLLDQRYKSGTRRSGFPLRARTERRRGMNYQEFVKGVQERADMSSREEAEQATRATLETLGERLAGGEPKDLASQLPPELGECLRYEGEARAEPFSLDEFFRRVAGRENIDEERATVHATAVMKVLGESVTGGEIEDVRDQLPQEFEPLLRS
jgi:uncharacterized protein (DUF2267 family)